MNRLGHPGLTPNTAASGFNLNNTITEDTQKFLEDRIKNIGSPLTEVLEDVNKIFSIWEEAIEKSKLLYSYQQKKEASNLLYPLGHKKNGYFKTPNSMRDVEQTAGIYLRED